MSGQLKNTGSWWTLDVTEKQHRRQGGAECRLQRQAERMEVGKLVMTPQQQVKAEGEERADCPERKEMNEKYNKGIVNGIWG